jgi:hypothetical protein
MNDPLFARAQLAIEESRELQRRSRVLRREYVRKRERLRLAVFESKMVRSESKACRDNLLILFRDPVAVRKTGPA